jgi:hypothetical protein
LNQLRGPRRPFFARTATLAALAAFALAGASTQARAQYVDEAARKPFAFRVGDYLPTYKETRQIGGTHNLALEFDYIAQRIPESSAVSVVSVGYIERENFRMIPLTIGLIFRDPGTGRNNLLGVPYYYGVGGGLYLTRMTAPDTDGRNKYIFGGYAVGGLDLTPTLFTEAKYHYVSRYDRKWPGGLQLSVGVRF